MCIDGNASVVEAADVAARFRDASVFVVSAGGAAAAD
jgi:hypothetical protein